MHEFWIECKEYWFRERERDLRKCCFPYGEVSLQIVFVVSVRFKRFKPTVAASIGCCRGRFPCPHRDRWSDGHFQKASRRCLALGSPWAAGSGVSNSLWGLCGLFVAEIHWDQRDQTQGMTNILGRLCIVPRPAASRLHVVRGPRVGNQRKRCPNCCYSHVVPLWRQRFHTAHCSRNCQAWCHRSFSSIFIHFPRPKSRPAPTKVK